MIHLEMPGNNETRPEPQLVRDTIFSLVEILSRKSFCGEVLNKSQKAFLRNSRNVFGLFQVRGNILLNFCFSMMHQSRSEINAIQSYITMTLNSVHSDGNLESL